MSFSLGWNSVAAAAVLIIIRRRRRSWSLLLLSPLVIRLRRRWQSNDGLSSPDETIWSSSNQCQSYRQQQIKWQNYRCSCSSSHQFSCQLGLPFPTKTSIIIDTKSNQTFSAFHTKPKPLNSGGIGTRSNHSAESGWRRNSFSSKCPR